MKLSKSNVLRVTFGEMLRVRLLCVLVEICLPSLNVTYFDCSMLLNLFCVTVLKYSRTCTMWPG